MGATLGRPPVGFSAPSLPFAWSRRREDERKALMRDVHQDGVGSVSADISRETVRLVREYTGRGPTKARTVIGKDTVAIILADTLTKGERSLVKMGETEHVL